MAMTYYLAIVAALFACNTVQGQIFKFYTYNANLPQSDTNFDGDLNYILSTKGITEDIKQGTVIGSLKAFVEGNPNAVINYFINSKYFTCNKTTGQTRFDSESGLDFEKYEETANEFTVHIRANVEGNSDLEIRKAVKMALRDANDNPPKFSNAETYSAEVSENTEVGTTFSNAIQCTDEDTGFHAQIQFSCYIPPNTAANDSEIETATLACKHFGVTLSKNPTGYTANIYTKLKLDYETLNSYAMSILAVDDPDKKGKVQLTASANIHIKITDYPDQLPVFSNAAARIFIQEHTAVGVFVGPNIQVADGDQGARRNLSISIQDPENLLQLVVSNDDKLIYTVRMKTANEIDRENVNHTASYSFSIVATEIDADGTLTSEKTEQNIVVSIIDVNDNAPEFDKSEYKVDLTEPKSKSIVPGLTLQVVDNDGTNFNNFSVLVESQTKPGTFRMSPESGVGRASFIFYIENVQQLDYEVPSNRYHEIRLKAVDNENPKLFTTAVIKINVMDANDNKPIFNPKDFQQSVREDIAVGTTIRKFFAFDPDSGENGRITYTLQSVYTEFGLNSSTGELYTEEKLDFEKTKQYSMFIQAEDNGDVKQIAYASIDITVLNLNDVGPTFLQSSYITTIREKSTSFSPSVQVTAKDPEGDTVTYRITSGNTPDAAFVMNPTTGQLSLKRALSITEAIKNSFFELTVYASDNGSPPQETPTKISITIQDVNDKNPIFNSTMYTETISEIIDTKSFVLQVFATDEDTGSNAQIRYEIQSGSLDHFVIDSSTGIIRVSNLAVLDFDANKRYEMKVLGIDNGSPPNSGSTTVVITLTDANNKVPRMQQVVYFNTIEEDLRVGSDVLDINATDTDANSDLEFSIPVSSISAKSKNVPIATSQYDFRVAFAIHPTTGMITVANSLQYDRDWSIEFRVEVIDKNAEKPKVQKASASVFISISDKKDPRPEFDSPWTRLKPVYPVTIDEELPENKVVATVLARDPDKTLLTNYEEIVGLDSNDYFRIDRTSGEVKVNKRIDYEKLNTVFPVQLKMGVKATSGKTGLVATATVVFSIQDKNDNKPEFTSKQYDVTVPEDVVHPHVVVSVYATDADSGSNKQFTYDLNGPYSEHFQIKQQVNPEEGQVIVAPNVTLDYEREETRVYNLYVIAQSSGESGTDSMVSLTIRVKDVNDNKPIFTKNQYQFYCVESLPVNAYVGLIEATDKDSGANSRLTYSFLSVGVRLFSLSEQGHIRINSDLAGASLKSPYIMKVMVKDSGTPTLSSTAMLNITVSSGQQDKGLPVFSYPTDANTKLSVYENANVGDVIMEAKAVARTVGASIKFAFFSNTEIQSKFLITEDGVVKVAGPLDRESKDSYDVIISATDTKNASLVSTRKVTIQILDIDDNTPSFKSCQDRQYSDPVEVTLREGSPVDTFVFQALACDSDLPPHNTILYKLYFDNANCVPTIQSYLKLDSNKGILYTKVLIDREEKSSLFVCIQALSGSSGSGRRKRATSEDLLRIRVNILDLNDQGPVFKVGRLTKVMFSLPKQDSVTSVLAVDPDSEFYNKVRYSIMDIVFNGNDGVDRTYGAFVIKPDTGELIVGFTSYRAFLEGYFNVTIKAEDFYDSTMFDTTWVKINVGEELDQVRVVTTTNYNQDIAAVVTNLLRDLQKKHPGWIFQETQIRYHKDVSGAFVSSKTDVCMLIVKDNTVQDSFDGANILKADSDLLKKYGFSDAGMCEPATTRELEGDFILWWVIVAMAIFMFVILVILIGVLRVLYQDYKHFMQTRQQYLVPIEK